MRGCKNQRFYIEAPDGELVIPPGEVMPPEAKEGSKIPPRTGKDGVWRWTLSKFLEEKEKGNVDFILSDKTSLITNKGNKSKWNVYYKIWLKDRLEDGQLPGNILEKFENRHSSAELKALNIPFEFAKPVNLIKFMMSLISLEKNDICLDFFAGSASTAHALFDYNMSNQHSTKFICVQLPEPIAIDTEEYKQGFNTIAEIGKERIRRAGQKIKEENPMFSGDTGFRVFKLDSTNIREWDPNRDKLAETLEASVDHLKTDRTEQDILFELLLKLGLDLCVPMETREIAGKQVHSIGAGTLMVCLDKAIQRKDAEPLALGIAAWHQELAPAGESQCVFRDSGFADDAAKTNLTKILEQHGFASKNIRSI